MGSIYRPKYKDRHGEKRTSGVWWIQYYLHGCPMRLSTGTKDYGEAKDFLKKREAGIEGLHAPKSLKPFSQHLRHWRAKGQACIYFLINSGEVVYVGKTKDLGDRLAAHRKDKQFDDVFFLPAKKEVLDKAEKALIQFYQPAMNKKQPSEIPVEEIGEQHGKER